MCTSEYVPYIRKRAQTFKMGIREVILSPDHPIQHESICNLVHNCDVIVINVPLNSETKYLINQHTLSNCSPTNPIYLINTSNASVIDEDALLFGLNQKSVIGAALDSLTWDPSRGSSNLLINHPNVICTPQLGRNNDETREQDSERLAETFINIFKYNKYTDVLNAPYLNNINAVMLEPYQKLVEVLGKLYGQILKNKKNNKIEIKFKGDYFKHKDYYFACFSRSFLIEHYKCKSDSISEEELISYS